METPKDLKWFKDHNAPNMMALMYTSEEKDYFKVRVPAILKSWDPLFDAFDKALNKKTNTEKALSVWWNKVMKDKELQDQSLIIVFFCQLLEMRPEIKGADFNTARTLWLDNLDDKAQEAVINFLMTRSEFISELLKVWIELGLLRRDPFISKMKWMLGDVWKLTDDDHEVVLDLVRHANLHVKAWKGYPADMCLMMTKITDTRLFVDLAVIMKFGKLFIELPQFDNECNDNTNDEERKLCPRAKTLTILLGLWPLEHSVDSQLVDEAQVSDELIKLILARAKTMSVDEAEKTKETVRLTVFTLRTSNVLAISTLQLTMKRNKEKAMKFVPMDVS